ncbi:hypothetical protein CQA20_29450, partial [Klebsiella pneumoniae]
AGYAAHREVGIAATPVMEALRQSIGWPSDVGVFDGDSMVVAHTSARKGACSSGAGYAAHREVGIAATPVMEALRQSIGWPSDVGV